VAKTCMNCGSKINNESIEVTVKIRGLVYQTYISGRTCRTCRETKVDPNALTVFKIGMAMKAVESGRLTGRRFAYCRKALRLGAEELAKCHNLSVECLLSLEDTDTPVPDTLAQHMRRCVRRYFTALAFVPRIPLDESRPPPRPSAEI